MSVRTGQLVVRQFTTYNPATGASQNADALPTGTLVVAGVDNAAAVTISSVASNGIYSFSVTLPALAIGNQVQVRINATVNGVNASSIQWQDSRDNLAITTSGTAQAGGATTITLAAAEIVFLNNYLQGHIVRIIAGTGAGQARVINSWVSGSQVAFVAPAWITNPDNTSIYAVYPALADVETWNGAAVPATDASTGTNLVKVFVPNNAIGPSQNFNNVGQTTPVSAIFIANVSGSIPAATSPPLSDVQLSVPIDYPWRQSFTVKNFDASAWTQIDFTVKSNTGDADSAAKITVKLSNPGVGTDGLILLNGAAPSGGTTAADGSIVVATATASLLTFAVTLTARGTAIAEGSYLAEATVYTAAGKQDWFGLMRLEAQPTLRANPTTS